MGQQNPSDDGNERQTIRDVYGEIDADDVEERADWDPALEPEGLTPETAPDGRQYDVAAWDGGVSDLADPAPEVHDMTDDAPAVLVYVSTQGGVQVHEGTLNRADARVVTVEADDGTVRTARYADMDGRPNAVENDDGRHLGTMLDVRLCRPWAALADHYGLPDDVDGPLYEAVAVDDGGDDIEVIATTPSRAEANQARSDWMPDSAEQRENVRGVVVRKRGDTDVTTVEEVRDDDDDDDDPEARTDGGEATSYDGVRALLDDIQAGDVEEGDTVTVEYVDTSGVDREESGTVTDVEFTPGGVPIGPEGRQWTPEYDSATIRYDSGHKHDHALSVGVNDTPRVWTPSPRPNDPEDHPRRQTLGEGLRGLTVEPVEYVECPGCRGDGERVIGYGLDDVEECGTCGGCGDIPTDHPAAEESRERDDDDDELVADGGQDDTCARCGGRGYVVGTPDADVDHASSMPSAIIECRDCGQQWDETGAIVSPGGPDDDLRADGGRRRDTDSPFEWTGEAHLVGASCDECGASVEVPESTAAAPGAVTCDDCTHQCIDHFGEARDDPALPPHVLHYECLVCGEFWTYDTQSGDLEVDR